MANSVLLAGGEILTMVEAPDCGNIAAPRVGWVATIDNKIALVTYEQSDVDAFLSVHADCEVVDCSGMVIMPGLINTHTHVSMTLMRNLADDMELMEWLNDHIWPFEERLTDEDITAGARLGIAEMILGGTTSFVDMYWNEYAVADAVADMGIRALLGESIVDGREERFKRNMALLAERCKSAPAGLIRPTSAPHAPYTCSPDTIKLAVSEAEKYDVPLTIHISESPTEQPMIAERYGVTPTEYVAQNSALTERTIVAHAIHLTESDIAQIADSGASVAHNAQSNMKLASGIAPIVKLTERGVNCTIATDSASSNNDLNMWEEIRTTLFLQNVATMNSLALGAYRVLYMATRNAAKAIGFSEKGSELGVLREGAIADIIAVDISAPHMRPRHNTISALVYCATAADVKHVVIDGALKLRNRVLLGQDVGAIIDDAEQRALNILAAINSDKS